MTVPSINKSEKCIPTRVDNEPGLIPKKKRGRVR